jgi:putative tryptophan/tyrosine transport system substrate-binding protein
MRRREFITLIGGAAAAWPVAALAQQPPMPLIGFLHSESPATYAGPLAAFRRGLTETGYVEGRNVTMEYRWAEGQSQRLPALAADLVRQQVAVIATPGSNAATFVAKAATTTIPIVFLIANNPVEVGLVASLNKPGSNLTGVTSLNVEVAAKQLELLHELVPLVTSVALLVNPSGPLAEPATRTVQAAARILGLKLQVFHASTERDFDSVFETLVKLQAGALVIVPDSLFTNRREQLGLLAVRHALPASAPYRDFAAAGGLMSYGSNIAEAYRLSGVVTGRVLKGERPAELPVMQSTKVELIINLKTAKTLGLTVPPSLFARADEVIE